MVLSGEFAVEAVRIGLLRNLASQNMSSPKAPIFGFTKPREGAARDELTGSLCEKMIVRRRPVAWKRRKKFLMMMKLLQKCAVLLEQLGGAAPVV